MILRMLIAGAVLVVQPSIASAEIRWVTVTEENVAVYKRVDSAKLISLTFFRDAKERWNVRWESDTGTSILYNTDDVTWARGLLKSEEFVRVDFINSNGAAVANSPNEQYWRWSQIRAVRCAGNPTICYLWSEGMVIGKPSNLRVTRYDERSKVLKLINRS